MTIDAINSRRSIRRFTAEPVERAMVDEILEAGRQAPSAANIQPARVLVIDEAEGLAKIRSAAYGIGALTEAPLVLLAMADLNAASLVGERVAELHAAGAMEPIDTSTLRSGAGNPFALKLGADVIAECVAITTAFMDLQATSIGLGTCWVHHMDAGQVRTDFHIPEDFAIIAALAIGWPAESPAARPRIGSIEWMSPITGTSSV